MYESPTEIIQTEMQMDGEILKAVQGVGIDVNKEELIKALAYDREQYVKGYKDGVKDLAERLRNKVKLPVGSTKYDGLVYVGDIDEITFEMVGGKKCVKMS